MFYIRRGRRTHTRKVVHKTRQKYPVRSLKGAALRAKNTPPSPPLDRMSAAAGGEVEARLDDLMRDRG